MIPLTDAIRQIKSEVVGLRSRLPCTFCGQPSSIAVLAIVDFESVAITPPKDLSAEEQNGKLYGMITCTEHLDSSKQLMNKRAVAWLTDFDNGLDNCSTDQDNN